MDQEMEEFMKLYESNHNSQYKTHCGQSFLKIVLNELLNYFYSQYENEERR